MKPPRWPWFAAAVMAVAALGITLGEWKLRAGVTATARGERVARKLGCFACHGPGGEAGAPNPGSDENAVPAWTGGTAMMYILAPQELDEWVLDGHPKRTTNPPSAGRLLKMPAYRGRIAPRDWNDLQIYLRAVMGLDAPAEGEAKAGYEIARDTGCFGCHGPSGRGLRGNPGSFAGYIPAWEGPPFADLVRDDAELREWIRSGTSRRLERNPVAAYFMKRQRIAMPAYERRLTDEQMTKIAAYIRGLRAPPQH